MYVTTTQSQMPNYIIRRSRRVNQITGEKLTDRQNTHTQLIHGQMLEFGTSRSHAKSKYLSNDRLTT